VRVSFTERLARAASRRPWVTIGAWIATIVVSFVCIGALLSSALETEFGLTNNPPSDRAEALITERIGEPDEIEEIVIVRSTSGTVDDAAFRAHVERITFAIRGYEGVESAVNYYTTNESSFVSEDRDATLIAVNMQGDLAENEKDVEPIIDLVEAENAKQEIDVFITGDASSSLDQSALATNDLKIGELYFGLPGALIILVFVFGALVAVSLPVIMAITSILVTIGLVAVIGQVYPLSFFIINMIAGMGLALGIDYTLFVLSRYREERTRGQEKLDAIATSGATASRAVFFSGFTFVIALLGMLFVPVSVLIALAAGAILVGSVAVVAALTLLPALLSALGDRVNRLHVPIVGRSVERAGSEGRFWSWVARKVMARPVVSLVIVVVFMLALAAPLLDLKVGSTGVDALPDKYISKQGFLVLNEEFAGATSAPIQIVVDGDVSSPEVRGAIDELGSRLPQTEPFGRPEVEVMADQDIARLTVPVSGDPEGPTARAGVRELHSDVIPSAFEGVDADVLVAGKTQEQIEYLDATSDWLPRVIVLVLGLSFILLTLAFRSIVVPLKAILLNLLSVGAAYGLLVLVFQKGYGADLLGLTKIDSIEAWVPVFLFSVLFGLSMDYHVFLLSRIRERYTQTGDNTEAVAHGVSTTARLITGAALIIIVVFTGFARGDFPMFQQMGFGVAVALLLDATIVRSVLVPASMKLLGDWNWYLPSWLEWLPHVGVEGPARAPEAPPGRAPAS
jgi:putative drug exporter of the RND superfamily